MLTATARIMGLDVAGAVASLSYLIVTKKSSGRRIRFAVIGCRFQENKTFKTELDRAFFSCLTPIWSNHICKSLYCVSPRHS